MKRFDAPLVDQAAQLSRSIHNRERKRNAEKLQRQLNAEDGQEVDVQAAAAKRQALNEGSAAVVAARAASAAAAAAAQLKTHEILRCDLCQASFPSEALYQQHVDGPVHQKALAKAQAEALKAAHTSQYQQLAEGAMAAAIWQQQGRTAGAAGPAAGQQQQQQQQQRGERQGGRAGQAAGNTQRQPRQQQGRQPRQPPPSSLLSHAELVASATAKDEPLSIDGWVPPAIISVAPPAAAVAPPADTESSDEEAQESDPGSSEEQQQDQQEETGQQAQQEGDREGAAGADADSEGQEGGLGGLLGYLDSGSDEDG